MLDTWSPVLCVWQVSYLGCVEVTNEAGLSNLTSLIGNIMIHGDLFANSLQAGASSSRGGLTKHIGRR